MNVPVSGRYGARELRQRVQDQGLFSVAAAETGSPQDPSLNADLAP
jgi:hypothetical protein